MKRLTLLSVVLLSSLAAHADDELSAAFTGCLNSAVAESKLSVKKSGFANSSTTILTIVCKDAPAQALFESVRNHAQELQSGGDGESSYIRRQFGTLPMPSECYRQIRDKDGNEINDYTCRIRLDIVSSMIQ